jgi:hypothetical protein
LINFLVNSENVIELFVKSPGIALGLGNGDALLAGRPSWRYSMERGGRLVAPQVARASFTAQKLINTTDAQLTRMGGTWNR